MGTGDVTLNVTTQLSLTADASGLKLVGDVLAPGNLFYYGSNSSGTKGWYAFSTSNIAEGTNLYFTAARVLATAITGFVSGAATLASTDTILQAINKLDGNVALKATLPTQTGNAGKALVTNGTTTSWLVPNAFTVSPIALTQGAASTPTIYLCNAAGGTITLTLPTAVGNAGLVFKIKKTDTSVNQVIVSTTLSQTIDGATSLTLKIAYASVDVVSDGTSWFVV